MYDFYMMLSRTVLVFSIFAEGTLIVVAENPGKSAPTTLTQQTVSKLSKRLGDLTKSEHTDDTELFRKLTHELDRFQLATKEADAKAYKRQREMKARLLLRIFAAIDMRIDHDFDFDDMPLANITPPAGSNVLESGVSSEIITDPKLRAEYEEAIRLNAVKAQQHKLQLHLRLLQKHQNRKLHSFTSYFFSDAETDQLELEKIILEEIPNEERRQRFLGILSEIDKKELARKQKKEKKEREFEEKRSRKKK